MAIQTAIICSDLHVGSTCAILRPGFKTTDGNVIGPNPVQLWMWEQFKSCCQEIKKLQGKSQSALILNGDLIDGNHHRTKEIVMVDEMEHARAAIFTLEPLIKLSSKTLVVAGTECHTKNLERLIGEGIGATRNPENGTHAFDMLNIEIHGCLGNIRHHMPTTSRTYLEASQLSIQLGNAQLSAVRQGDPMPKWIAGAHRHTPGYYSDGNGMMVVTPSWQGLTRYAQKVVPDGKMVVGMAFLDWRGKEKGELPKVTQVQRRPDVKKRIQKI